MPAARRFEDHGAVAAGRELPELEQVTTSARRVHVPERDSERDQTVQELPGLRLRARRPSAHQRRRSSRWCGSGSAEGLRDCTRASASSISIPSRSATTPAAIAAERCQPARQCTYVRSPSFSQPLTSSTALLDRLGVEPAVVDQPQAALLDLVGGQRALDRVALAAAVLAVLDQVEDAAHAVEGEHLDVV